MFERYTEKARRSIFFARHEASQYGSPYIESEHLLLGVLREDKALSQRTLRGPASLAEMRKAIDARTEVRARINTAVDLPLSNESKRALAYAAEEAERLHHHMIGTEHLVLGLLREEGCFAATLLKQYGVTLAVARDVLKQHGPAAAGIGAFSGASGPFGLPVTTLRVADLEASVAFYTALGFQPGAKLASDRLRLLTRGMFPLVLFEHSLGETLLCLIGGNLRAVALELEARGALQEPLATAEDGTRSLLLRDPDGHLVCLLAIQAGGFTP